MSATCSHVNAPLNPRKITSCTFIARSPASGAKAIATSSMAICSDPVRLSERSCYVLVPSGHMMCSLQQSFLDLSSSMC